MSIKSDTAAAENLAATPEASANDKTDARDLLTEAMRRANLTATTVEEEDDDTAPTALYAAVHFLLKEQSINNPDTRLIVKSHLAALAAELGDESAAADPPAAKEPATVPAATRTPAFQPPTSGKAAAPAKTPSQSKRFRR